MEGKTHKFPDINISDMSKQRATLMVTHEVLSILKSKGYDVKILSNGEWIIN